MKVNFKNLFHHQAQNNTICLSFLLKARANKKIDEERFWNGYINIDLNFSNSIPNSNWLNNLDFLYYLTNSEFYSQLCYKMSWFEIENRSIIKKKVSYEI